jgi:hypothetical protein
MKLYAQYGYGDGQKTAEGLAGGLIDGIIYSPKDIPLPRLVESAGQLRKTHRRADILFDPQFYASIPAVDPAANLGNLENESDDAREYAYFQPRRRSQLLSERQLFQDLDAVLKFQTALPVTALIAPNILVPRSFDSAESAICMDFIRNTRVRYDKLKDKRPVFATLAIAREALMDKDELLRFLNDLTVLDARPDGFYVLIAVNSTEARSEIYHADVIAGWMFINHVLKLNGYQVVNGYSDILTPFLGAVGATAGATGWWSNLRAFSMDRFSPPLGAGRLPIERYLSCQLLNRIAFYELGQLREVLPVVLNELPTDELYPEETSQPQRNQEVLQSWDAIRELNQRLVRGSLLESLRVCGAALEDARNCYSEAGAALPQPFDTKSNDQHIEPLQEGLRLFATLAELDGP